MDDIHIHTRVERDGEISLNGLPVKAGQDVDITVQIQSDAPALTAEQLAESEIVGMWADRTDIPDSPAFAEKLREQAQRRRP
jgi:hypothetical protein